MIDPSKLRTDFISKYGGGPRIFRAPGRVNLIGEHTDYNEGFVLPCAIDFATCVAGSRRDDRRIRVASLNFGEEFDFDLDDTPSRTEATWARYVQGVGSILEREGYHLSRADLLIDSDVPVGAGLSSSAALEVSVAFALLSLSGHEIEGMKLARIGQAAEHEYAGVNSGIMDQFASVFGQTNHALFLDCRSMDWESIQVSSARFMICNTKSKHELADGEYNKRRDECDAAARFFRRKSLRDVTLEEFDLRSAGMPEVPRKRARHVITENLRVLNAVEALRSGNLTAFGELMNESHKSLRDDFHVSSYELDLMVDITRRQNGVLGSRMTGGGFGGCTISLLEPGDHQDFAHDVSDGYHRETGLFPDIYQCNIDRGVCQLDDPKETDGKSPN